MAVVMAISIGAGTALAPRVTTPIFEDTDGVRVPTRVIRILRYGTIGGGTLSTAGFLALAAGEFLRIGELGLVGIAGIVLGGGPFSIALGASIALVLKVRVVQQGRERPRRSRAEK
jgi:hypothetical protein